MRHFTTKEDLLLIIKDGFLRSLKEEGKEKGRVYFEEYHDNDYLLDFILSDETKKHLTKDNYVSLFFDSTVLKQHDIKIEKSTDLTKLETTIGIGTIFTKEEQSQIGDYYIVTNQNVPLQLSTKETKKMLEGYNGFSNININ
ncbi:hypothetical protein ACOJQI_21200 [Bacillus salacetis]|uniref:hypothetical protein n=1 Tax=Bacillus salacetis TaxID=2315464 RepID=UPI003B9DCB7B